MGLDWLVGAKPKNASDYDVLRRSLANPKDQAFAEAWKAVPKINSWETLGAPRVGESAEADAWFVDRFLQDASPAEQKEWLAKNRGVAVVALVKCDGVPPYSNAPMNRELEYSSFRGAFLSDAVSVIGEAMLERAHQNMLPDELGAFANELQAIARRYANEHGVADVAKQYAPPGDGDGPATIAHIMASAARWCSFWASRGHWLESWW